MTARLGELLTRVRCPDCDAWLDVITTLGPGRRGDAGWTVPVSFDRAAFVAEVVRHVAGDPAAHPTLATRREGTT